MTIAPADSDRYVTYSGSAVSIPITGAVGVLHGIASIAAPALSLSFKTAGSRIIFPHEFAGRTKSVAVFNLNGTLMKSLVTTAGSIDLRKDLGKSRGAHLIKIRTLP